MLYFSCPSVSSGPERAQGARAAFGVVDSRFMRATGDSISHGDRLCPIRRYEFQYFFEDIVLFHDVVVRVPFLHRLCIGVFLRGDSNDELGGLLVRRTIEGDGADRIKSVVRQLLVEASPVVPVP